MPIGLQSPQLIAPVPGLHLGVAEAGVKTPGRKDLLVIAAVAGTRVAGVFTQNAFAAAPVQICRRQLAAGVPIRALVINSGNANAATGAAGEADAQAVTAAVAAALGCLPEQVLPFSTGVIGQRLPVERMCAAVPRAVADLRDGGWADAMRAIMTTDTRPKGATRRVETAQGPVTVSGIAKGVGMIHPNMATMLAFIGTDARIESAALQRLLRRVADSTFNCVTVDGDTSTNDACMLLATGQRGAAELTESDVDFALVAAAIHDVAEALAKAIVRDGEGATKFIEIEVSGAASAAEARQVALKVAHSPLVKTAMFASDANWGRIVMAIGNAGVPALDPAGVGLALDDVVLLVGGQPHPDYQEALGAAVVAKPEFVIRISLGRGSAQARVWTCDLSYEYIKINAEYRT